MVSYAVDLAPIFNKTLIDTRFDDVLSDLLTKLNLT